MSAGRGTRSSSRPARRGSVATGGSAESNAAHGTETRGQLAPLRRPRPPRYTRYAGRRKRSDQRGPRNESAHGNAAQTAHSALRNRLGTERTQPGRLESAGNGPAHRARAALSRSGRKSERARRVWPAVNGAVRPRDALWARLRK